MKFHLPIIFNRFILFIHIEEQKTEDSHPLDKSTGDPTLKHKISYRLSNDVNAK